MIAMICLFTLVSCGGKSSGKGASPVQNVNPVTFDDAKLFGTFVSECLETPKRQIKVTFTPEFKFTKKVSYHDSSSVGCTAGNETMTTEEIANYKTAEKVEGTIYGLDLTYEDNQVVYTTLRLNDDASIHLLVRARSRIECRAGRRRMCSPESCWGRGWRWRANCPAGSASCSLSSSSFSRSRVTSSA